MDRPLVEVLLQYENTGALSIYRIVFHYNAVENTSQDIPGQDVFVRHLIVAVVRYPYLSALNQSTNLVEGHTHSGSLTCVLPAWQVQRRDEQLSVFQSENQ
ncbi:MAG: hypothetical protein A2253_01665 [Deltaproteobacteria bacterium RIFOXYA2_FULL_55_11]|nr:MAG: hypothetical protein A2253_01665 [Deltaproteobacteria bacterium RIFOXYA2_FULL_55_11]